MPIERRSIFGELSLRNIPNTSDASSISIQIPNTPSLLRGGFLLGGEDDASFLRDMAGASMATPGPSKSIFQPSFTATAAPAPAPAPTNPTRSQPPLRMPSSHDLRTFPKARDSPTTTTTTKPKSKSKSAKSKLKHTPRDVDLDVVDDNDDDDDHKALLLEKKPPPPPPMTPYYPSEGAAMEGKNLVSGTLETSAFSVHVPTTTTTTTNNNNDDNENNSAPEDAISAETLERQRDHPPETRQLNSKRDRPIARSRRTIIASESSKTQSQTTSLPNPVTGPDSHQQQQQQQLQNSTKAEKLRVSSDNEDLICGGERGFTGSRTIPIHVDDGLAGRSSAAAHSPKRCNMSGSLASENNNASASKTNPEPTTTTPKGVIALSNPGESFPRSSSSSPTRPSTKRPASIVDPDQSVPKKRGKVTASASTANATVTAINVQAPPKASSSSSQNARRRVPAGGVRERKEASSTATRQALRSTTSRLGNRTKTKLGPVVNGTTTTQVSQKRVELPPLNPTKPIEFKFRMDERIEVRKSEHENDEKRSGHVHKSVMPEYYKMMTTQQQQQQPHAEKAKHGQLKENITPMGVGLKPYSFSFGMNTEGRAREREKFNQHVREKELEQEQEREQRRKEREEKEAREIRELRRKAVPRAHEVPEWYKDAPKRKVCGD